MRWQEAPTESFCDRVLGGGTPSTKKHEYYDGDIPWLRTQEVVFNYISHTDRKITAYGLQNSSATWVPANSVIVAMFGASAARVAINKIPLTTNQACCNLVVDAKKADFRYVFYALRSRYKALEGLARGAAQNNLNAKIIREFNIPSPPTVIQNTIGGILSNYDELIENNRRRVQLLEESARLLYKEWFVHLRFPGHEHVKVVDGIPEGWEKEFVGAMLTLQRGFDLPTMKRVFGEFPIYASTGINGFHKEAKVKGPGVVTGRSGSLGTVIYVQNDHWPLNTTLWVKEFKKVTPLFATHLLRGLSLERYNGGAAVPTLNRNDVHKIEVLCPPQKFILLFEEFIGDIYLQIDKLKDYNTKLAEARDILLPRLINGEINV